MTNSAVLSEQEIKERLNGTAPLEEVIEGPVYEHVSPLTKAADNLIEVLGNAEGRVMTGITQLDLYSRGFGPSELIFVTGFAHSGKTQLLLTTLLHNKGRRCLIFSLDDPTEMLLTKLVCMKHGLNAEVFEQAIRDKDSVAKKTLTDFAEEHSNLVIIDDPLSLDQMATAVAEASDLWGAPPEMVGIDYLGLMPNGLDEGASAASSKSQALKRWVKSECAFPVVCIHHGSRGSSAPGKPITLMSMAYGGEQEGTIVIGARRKRDDDSLDNIERARHLNTITLHVPKNKRAGGKRTEPDGIDLFMDPTTGLIRALQDGDMPGIPGQASRLSGKDSIVQFVSDRLPVEDAFYERPRYKD